MVSTAHPSPTHAAAGPAHSRASIPTGIARGTARWALRAFQPRIVAFVGIQLPRSQNVLPGFNPFYGRRGRRRGRNHGGSWLNGSRGRLSMQILCPDETQSKSGNANRFFHSWRPEGQYAPIPRSPKCLLEFPHSPQGSLPDRIQPGALGLPGGLTPASDPGPALVPGAPTRPTCETPLRAAGNQTPPLAIFR